MNLFVYALLVVAAMKLGWALAKIAMVWYERQRNKKFQNDLKTYIEENRLKYEKKQNKKDSGEDFEIPKRD